MMFFGTIDNSGKVFYLGDFLVINKQVEMGVVVILWIAIEGADVGTVLNTKGISKSDSVGSEHCRTGSQGTSQEMTSSGGVHAVGVLGSFKVDSVSIGGAETGNFSGSCSLSGNGLAVCSETVVCREFPQSGHHPNRSPAGFQLRLDRSLDLFNHKLKGEVRDGNPHS